MVSYDQLAADYARHRQVHPEVVRQLVENGQLDSTCCVLEVGCGTVNYLRTLQRRIGCSGVEIDGMALPPACVRTVGLDRGPSSKRRCVQKRETLIPWFIGKLHRQVHVSAAASHNNLDLVTPIMV